MRVAVGDRLRDRTGLALCVALGEGLAEALRDCWPERVGLVVLEPDSDADRDSGAVGGDPEPEADGDGDSVALYVTLSLGLGCHERVGVGLVLMLVEKERSGLVDTLAVSEDSDWVAGLGLRVSEPESVSPRLPVTDWECGVAVGDCVRDGVPEKVELTAGDAVPDGDRETVAEGDALADDMDRVRRVAVGEAVRVLGLQLRVDEGVWDQPRLREGLPVGEGEALTESPDGLSVVILNDELQVELTEGGDGLSVGDGLMGLTLAVAVGAAVADKEADGVFERVGLQLAVPSDGLDESEALVREAVGLGCGDCVSERLMLWVRLGVRDPQV